jgi:hypothetical protein
LHREDVLRVAVEVLRPEVETVGGLDQLGGDPQAVSRALDTSFEHGGDAEFPPDAADILGRVAERERGRPGRHVEAFHVGEGIDQRLGHAIAEIGVGALGAQVDEGQHRHRSGLDSPAPACAPQEDSTGQDHDRHRHKESMAAPS